MFFLNLTFSKRRNLHWQANDSNQVLNGHQRPEDCSDPQSLTFTCLNELGTATQTIQIHVPPSPIHYIILKNRIKTLNNRLAAKLK